MKRELLKRNWLEGNGCYFKEINSDIWYYNISAHSFSIEENHCGISEYVCEGDLENLEKIEKGEF